MRKKSIIVLIAILLASTIGPNVLASELTTGTVEAQKNVEVEIQKNTDSEENIDMETKEVYQGKETRGSSKGNAEQIVFNKENIYTINKSCLSYDWKKIVVPSDGYIDISLDKAIIGNGEKNVIIHLENEAGKNYFSANSSTIKDINSSKNTWRIGLSPGTYYLMIDFPSVSSGEVNFKYNINFTESKYFEKEKNDSFDTATSMKFAQTYGGVLYPTTYDAGVDYYCIDINDSDVVVNFKLDIDEKFFDCSLYNNLRKKVDYSYTDYEDGGTRKYIYRNLTPGKYYIRLSSNRSSGYKLKVPYELKVTSFMDIPTLYQNAYNAMRKAEQDKTQTSINEARTLIDELIRIGKKNNDEHLISDGSTWSSMVDAVQHPKLKKAVDAILKAQETKKQEDINEAYNSVEPELPDHWKLDYTGTIDVVQQELINEATKGTEDAEAAYETVKNNNTKENLEKAQVALETAEKLVSSLATSVNGDAKNWANNVLTPKLSAIKLANR